MRKITYLLLIGFVLQNCSESNLFKSSTKKNIPMEKFDFKKFQELNIANENKFIQKDSTEVKFIENIENYQKNISKINSPIRTSKIFYKKSLNLKKEGEFFNNFPVGIHREYSNKGTLVKEINYDSAFLFSLDDLKLKINNMFHKDIMDISQRIGVSRSTNPFPHYIITIPLSKFPRGDFRVLKINGETGDVTINKIKKYNK